MDFSRGMTSIRNKILLYFLLLILPIAAAGIVSYGTTLRVVSRMVSDSVENMLQRVGFESDRMMKEAQDFAWMISRDSTIQFALREPLPSNNPDIYKQRLDFNFRLYFTNLYREDILGFYVIGKNGAIFKSSMMTPKDIDFREQDWYKRVLESGSEVWFEPHDDSFVTKTVGDRLISVGVPIIDRFSGSALGMVLVDMDVARFEDNYDARLVREGRILLLNAENDVLFSSSPEDGVLSGDAIGGILAQADFSAPGSTKTLEARGSSYFVSHRTLAPNGWKNVGIIPTAEITKDASGIAVTVALLLSAVAFAAVFIAVKASTSISRPITKMRDTMKRVQNGDMGVRADVETLDEIGQLAISFNNMIEQINVLMREQEEQQTKLRKAEQRALQAQINPHFLYNTLDSISWMARAKNLEQIEETIEALTSLFRISLSRGRDIITLEEELRHVHSYLRIQQIRYSKKMSYSIDVPKSLYGCSIVKMTLQPLVENAIYHGIKEKREKGSIRIEGYECGPSVVLKITDTGKGMPKERLDALNRAICEDEDFVGEGMPDSYGVMNVQRRVRIFFGSRYGLHYESVYQEGTVVTITLPS